MKTHNQNNIRKLRKYKKMNQKQLATIIGVNQSTLSNFETGRYELNEYEKEMLSQALDCKPEDLIKQDFDISTPEPDNKQENTLPKEIINTIQEMVIQEKASLSHKKQLEIALKTLYCLMQDFKPEAITKDVILATMKGISFGE